MSNWFRITLVIGVAYLHPALAADIDPHSLSLDQLREVGRKQSRFLTEQSTRPTDPKESLEANLSDYQKFIAPVLQKHCLACHGPKQSEGRLRVDKLNPDLLTGDDVERWREIYNVLSNSEMPPDYEPDYALADTDRGRFVDWLSNEIDKAAQVRRNTSRHSSFRRMTKYEYDYALQDLLGLPFSMAARLPPETASEDGFKNSSNMLQMSAMQFETYREIGLKALQRATVIGERPQPVTYVISMQEEMERALSEPKTKVFHQNDANSRSNRNRQHLFNRATGKSIHFSDTKTLPRTDAVADESSDVSPVVLVLPRSKELKINLDRFLPDDGIMRVRIRAGRTTSNDTEYAALRLGFSAHTSNNANFSNVISERDILVTASADQPEFIHFDIPLSDIQRNPFRKLDRPFPRRDEFLHIRNISNARGGKTPLHVVIDRIEVIAPFYEQWPPKSHTDIFFPSDHAADETAYGREVLSRFTRRVWRRPVTTAEVDRLMTLFEEYRPQFDNFEEAMLEVLATVLAAPEFLYLTSTSSAEPSEKTHSINDWELASRLSFFLWSSIPDDELLSVAAQGTLSQPTVLTAQVDRMLADPRSRRFFEHFTQQWLSLDGLNSATHITDADLKNAMREEPIAFFEHVLKNDRSAMDFLHADYVVVNERLARHYRIPNVFGPHFRQVPVMAQSKRGGILTGAGVLAMNSDGQDSHPLKRGVWMLERVLHDPPPPPPPNVPEVDLTDPEILKMTLKERIANHRNQAACVSCHSRIDPWGIVFENYDAMGAYRTRIKDQPVDATSELFNKQELAGMDGLKRYLLMDRQDQFARAIVHKLTSYALGRPLSFSDHTALEDITKQFRRRGDRLRPLIDLIVQNELFRKTPE
ncbi:DUF1592 domain-containing protein [Thalassoroseus pseudoceratinae]|uniref:DUF1592 domain-containing protein n=1 Tax=Thalassoroseus pseudoceratinae TaxID=2713176 RepID=UPI001424054D|nr:DUF1592 domain-containing protein [Thalassoroseus pseudoceratinae]